MFTKVVLLVMNMFSSIHGMTTYFYSLWRKIIFHKTLWDCWISSVLCVSLCVLTHFLFHPRRRRPVTAVTLTKSLSTRSPGCRVPTGRSSTALTRRCSETSPLSTRGWLATQHADNGTNNLLPYKQATQTQTALTVTKTNCRDFRPWMSQNFTVSVNMMITTKGVSWV